MRKSERCSARKGNDRSGREVKSKREKEKKKKTEAKRWILLVARKARHACLLPFFAPPRLASPGARVSRASDGGAWVMPMTL